MPNRRFDWHEHIRDVWGEYWSTREAVNRLKAAVVAMPDLLEKNSPRDNTSALPTRTLKGLTSSDYSRRSRRRSAHTIGPTTMTRAER